MTTMKANKITKAYLRKIRFVPVDLEAGNIINSFWFGGTHEGHAYWWDQKDNLSEEAKATYAEMLRVYQQNAEPQTSPASV
jgi:hypothetical protein